MTIIKVQVTLATNDPDLADMALIYAEDRKFMTQQRLHPAVRRLMNGDAKAFFEANFRSGRWEIGKRVEDQDW
ncbi:hypothetical protein [Bradyrhizobium sp. USDA 313]|uniref:hypothetical protein n=1 Tax=Bradyrhizobium sp. USDA 313 TaxID=3156307 RepID=UPI0035150033